jgi:hypothetical protein
MMNVYLCDIVANTDITIPKQHLFNRILEGLRLNDKSIKILFYFYCNKPRDPVCLWIEDNHIRLEPGNNRYLACLLQEKESTIRSVIVTKHSIQELQKYNYKNLKHVSTVNIPYLGKSKVADINEAMNEISKIDGYNFELKWRNSVLSWLNENLKYSWVFKYKSYTHNLHNSCRFDENYKPTETISFDGSDYDTPFDGLKAFFKYVKETENIEGIPWK